MTVQKPPPMRGDHALNTRLAGHIEKGRLRAYFMG